MPRLSFRMEYVRSDLFNDISSGKTLGKFPVPVLARFGGFSTMTTHEIFPIIPFLYEAYIEYVGPKLQTRYYVAGKERGRISILRDLACSAARQEEEESFETRKRCAHIKFTVVWSLYLLRLLNDQHR